MGKSASRGGLPRELARRAFEHVLWLRVAGQLRVERMVGYQRPRPDKPPRTGVLASEAEWRAAVTEAKRLRLPLHPGREKNWDALGAVAAVLDAPLPGLVLDAGSARYSPVLPWLRLYGLNELMGMNLEFEQPVEHQGVRFVPGDIVSTGLSGESVSAITCMSVIEHGVPLEPFLREAARILRPGGVLVVSTDYDWSPEPTHGNVAYGQPVHIFSPEEVRELLKVAEDAGLSLVGPLELSENARPVHWKRMGLHFTFLLLIFKRSPN